MPRPTLRTTDEIWDAFSSSLLAAKEKRPSGSGWLTVHQIGKKIGKSFAATHTFIRRNRDKFDQFRGCVAKGNRLVTAVWWKPKQSTKQPIKRLKTQGNHP